MAVVDVEDVIAQLDIDGTPAQVVLLETYIEAADDYIACRFGPMPSGTFTQQVNATRTGLMVLRHTPVLTITSATSIDGATVYSSSFTVDPLGVSVTHPNITTSGTWTVVYTSGFTTTPADLKLAVLFDIEGLYRTSQLGPPGALGIAAMAGEYQAEARNPIVLWPRIDRWLSQYPTVA